jgi:hypothetical protein
VVGEPDDGLRFLSEREWNSPSCAVCLAAVQLYGVVETLRGEVLSPAGKWHSADGDRTLCGKDATPNGWWWPA